jgi:hypothetical protein
VSLILAVNAMEDTDSMAIVATENGVQSLVRAEITKSFVLLPCNGESELVIMIAVEIEARAKTLSTRLLRGPCHLINAGAQCLETQRRSSHAVCVN